MSKTIALFFLCLGCIMASFTVAGNGIRLEPNIVKVELPVQNNYSNGAGEVNFRPKSKTVAVTLAVTLGVFGVHRLYLGTSNKVPIIYTLTLGGGFGALVVSDIVAILANKDPNAFSPSENVFMWAK
ncbi:MAG: TM2 domain-containing protein [Salibacteraceae bacterium]